MYILNKKQNCST